MALAERRCLKLANEKEFLSLLMSIDPDDLEEYTAYSELGLDAMVSGDYKKAEEAFLLACQYARDVFGPDSWLVADALENLSFALEKQNRTLESDMAQLMSDHISRRQSGKKPSDEGDSPASAASS